VLQIMLDFDNVFINKAEKYIYIYI
jgi:hypothetical protein